jgi:hypothetical protein
MLFREIIILYFETHIQHMNALGYKNHSFLMLPGFKQLTVLLWVHVVIKSYFADTLDTLPKQHLHESVALFLLSYVGSHFSSFIILGQKVPMYGECLIPKEYLGAQVLLTYTCRVGREANGKLVH